MGSKAACVLLFSSTGESAWGSTGAANRKLQGLSEAALTVTNEAEEVPNVGYYGPGPLMDRVKQAGEVQIEGVMSYEEAPKILNGLFAALSVPSSSDATGYTWRYNAPVNSTQACRTFTVDYGTSNEAYRASGTIFNGIKITGEAGSYWKFSIPGLAKQIVAATTGMTQAGLDDTRTVTAVAMADTQLRIHDFTAAAFGTSSGLVPASLVNFELNCDAKRHLKFRAGSIAAQGWGDGKMEGSLKVRLEFNTTEDQDGKTLVDSMLGSTGVQLQKMVSLYATRTSSEQQLAAYFAGLVKSPYKLFEDEEGNLVVDLEFGGKFSTAFGNGSSGTGNWLGFKVVGTSCGITS